MRTQMVCCATSAVAGSPTWACTRGRHGMTANAYRSEHGLGRRGLVASEMREQLAANASASLPAKTAFLARRDPDRARAIQAELGAGMSPAGQEAVREALRARPRKAIVIQCEGCGSMFCPLRGGRRRRFCSMSCSNRANRALRRS